MTFYVAGAIVGSAVIGGYTSNKASKIQANAARDASQLQSDAGIRAAEIQREIANATIAEQRRQFNRNEQLQKPFYNAGVGALNQLVPLASNYTPFGMEQFEADPGYSFRMDEGMKALERSAAARGGLLSGSAMKGIQRFGQGLASEEYTNAFNRYQTERQARLNPLQSLTGMAQTSTGQLGQAGQTMASNVGELGMQAANARASGYVGGANALTSGMNSYLNYSQGQGMINAMNQNRAYSSVPYNANTTIPMQAGGGY